MSNPVPAENNPPDYITTGVVIRDLDGKPRSLVIPRDVTPVEGACLSAFLSELAGRFTGAMRWSTAERVKHYGLERMLVEGEKL